MNDTPEEDLPLTGEHQTPNQRSRVFKTYKELSDWVSWAKPTVCSFQYKGDGIEAAYIEGGQ